MEHRYLICMLFKKFKQRNQLLRHGRIDKDSLRAWTQELIPLNKQITHQRNQYLSQLEKHIGPVVEKLDGLGDVIPEYVQGWSKGADIAEVFENDLERDIASGNTSGHTVLMLKYLWMERWQLTVFHGDNQSCWCMR